MPYLIDGNNLCGAARDRRLGLPVGEQEMLRLLADYARRRSAQVTIVFDGPAGERRGAGRASRAGGVRVVYSGIARTADDRIIDLAGCFVRPRDIILVTSDRALGSRARSLGCHLMGCREFARLVARAQRAGGAADAEGEMKPLPGDTAMWERYFEGDK